MPPIAVIVLPLVSLIFAIETAPAVIKSVALNGTGVQVNLTTQVGQPYNDRSIEKDLRELWSTGRFDDIRVETTEDEDGTAIVFKVVENRDVRLHEIRVEPSSYGLRFTVPEGTQLTRRRVHEIALEAQRQLNSQGYLDARVDWSLAPYAGNQSDLRLAVKAGDPMRVKEVEFTGDSALDARELRGELRALRIRRVLPKLPGLWDGWRLFPAYSPEAVDADAARLRSWYLSNGYFDVDVRADDVELRRTDAKIRFVVRPGPRFQVREWTVDHWATHAEGSARPEADLCTALFRERRDAERHGIPDFWVRLKVQRTDGGARLSAEIDRGQAYRVGRIDFAGNRHFEDAFVRRNLLLDEGDLFDQLLLRKSIARLNRSAAFEPVTDANVAIRTSEKSGEAAIGLQLVERKHGAWRLSGPVGPASFGGPLEASISSRLPAWGAGLFELSTYAASFSLLGFARPIIPVLSVVSKGPLLPVLALERPFSPGEGWKSGMAAAPQLGWRFSALGYAATQLRQRLIPRLMGDRGLIQDLPVTVERPQAEMTMVCEPPKPRFTMLRTGAALGLQFAGAALGF
jgi:outer membrane protein insertion porin family